MMEKKFDIAVIGLGVMGSSLALNILDHGYSVAVSNRNPDKIINFMKRTAKNANVEGFTSLRELVANLKLPRKLLLMVSSGEAVTEFISQIAPLLDDGDIIIDGGNSDYRDSQQRAYELKIDGINFIGMGVSGGEEGARKGPSLMPGGNKEAWPHVKEILEAISAKNEDGTPCCRWLGDGGSGHFVKMVHNGIEYADMQAISEVYQLLKEPLKYQNLEIAEIFSSWNDSQLSSYLTEITSKIFRTRDTNGNFIIDNIKDSSGQKGTGKLSSLTALNYDTAIPSINEAVTARLISNQADIRLEASNVFSSVKKNIDINISISPEKLECGLTLTRALAFVQGFDLIKKVSAEQSWGINCADIALIWQNGCIIRNSLLFDIARAYQENNKLQLLLLDPFFAELATTNITSLRQIVIFAISRCIPTPVLSSSLNYFDSITSAKLPANLIQAQRDFFGSHGYTRINDKSNKIMHTNWQN